MLKKQIAMLLQEPAMNDSTEMMSSEVGGTALPNIQAGAVDLAPLGRRRRTPAYHYEPGSIWSHLMYGLATLAVIILPPLIPGVSVRGLVMGYMIVLALLVATGMLWATLRAFRSRSHHASQR